MRKRAAEIAIAVVIVLGLILTSGCHDAIPSGPRTLSVNADRFSPGDEIVFTASITGPGTLVVYQELCHSFHLMLGLRVPYQTRTIKSLDGIQEIACQSQPGSVQTFRLRPEDTEAFEIRGRVSETEGEWLFEFDDYGSRFAVDKGKLASSLGLFAYGFWKPVNPAPADSLEDYTNHVDVSLMSGNLSLGAEKR